MRNQFLAVLYSTRHAVTCTVIGLLLCLSGTAPATAQSTPALQYGRRIAAPAAANDRLRAALNDLRDSLQKMTGAEYSSGQEYSGAGIFLMRSQLGQAPADAVAKLKGKGREPFIIRSTDSSRLWIIANGDEGLSHGIYFYLEQLGCHWFLPGDNWTVIPRRQDIAVKMDRLVEPAFKLRSFFGTGGFGGLAPYDPQLTLKTRWYDWQRRNRFGGEMELGGHVGEDFNLRHKETLIKHPEYLAEVNGKREWSISSRLDPTNKDAVKLWVEDRIAAYRAQRKALPDSPYSWAVSVDPSDGGASCNSEECKQQFKTESDQVFFLANETAKALRKEFPDGWVNLYGYAGHSAPPTFAVEPNVYVQVIPYGFNYSGLGPEDLIRAWGKKTKALGLYDYWSITDWTYDEPSFDYLTASRQKLRFWRDNNINGFHAESTYSAGAMGIAWYLAARQMWNPDVNQQVILENFYRKCFGPAAGPMQRMMERWANGFMLTSAELGLSFRDMQEARRLAANDAAALARVDDFGRYLHYLRLRLEVANTTDAAQRLQLERKLIEHIFDIYDTAMVASFRLYQLYVDYGRKTELFNEFNNEKKDAPGWQRTKPLSSAEVAALMTDGARAYAPPNFEMKFYTGELVPFQPEPYKARTGEDKWTTRMPTNGAVDVELLAPAGLKVLPLRVSRYYDQDVTVNDSQGHAIFKHRINGVKAHEPSEEMEVPLSKPGRYTIQFRPRGGGFNFQTAAGVPLAMKSFLSEMGAPSPRLYFFVPRGLKTLAMYYPTGALGSTPVTILDPDGKTVPLDMKDNGRLITVKIEPGQDGKVWSLRDNRSPNAPHRMLNVPHAFSFSPTTLLVPKDALQ